MRAAAVVVPAHDEEALLPACMQALSVAVARVDIEVLVLAVLDDCTDGSQAACARHGVGTLLVEERNAGRARALGLAAAIADLTSRWPLEEIWLATTDADSRVAPDWLSEQLRRADDGADAVFGVVDVDDWSDHGPRVPGRFLERYAAFDPHPHRHGACLGLRADRYLEVGGMPALAVGEDQALAALLEQIPGLRVDATLAVRVTTSARRRSRVVGGFATLLASLA